MLFENFPFVNFQKKKKKKKKVSACLPNGKKRSNLASRVRNHRGTGLIIQVNNLKLLLNYNFGHFEVQIFLLS